MASDKQEHLAVAATFKNVQGPQHELLRSEKTDSTFEMFRSSRNKWFSLKWILRISVAGFILWILVSNSNFYAVFTFKNVRATISEERKPSTQRSQIASGADIIKKPTTEPYRVISGDLNQITYSQDRKQFVKQMMIHAWDGYKKYAWGFQELDPVNNKPRHGALFDGGGAKLGLTIVDALSTLQIMGLDNRFSDAKKWVKDYFTPAVYPASASVFEWNIRYVGGLLSAYALTKDEIFKHKAVEAANFLMPAFGSATGIPYSVVFKNGGANNGAAAVLSEIGTLHLEFEYLSFITGNNTYAEKVHRAREALRQKPKTAGLYPSMISPDNPNADIMGGKVSFGAMSDSFYEYLLKAWLITKRKDTVAKQMYVDAVKAMETKGVLVKTNAGTVFAGELRFPSLGFAPIMDHFACFAGGMFAMHGDTETNSQSKEHWLSVGKGLGKACQEGYAQTSTGLGPDRITFHGNKANGGGGYFQRPEAVETWFFLWRITKDTMYREWAWNFVKAVEKHTKTESGYTGLTDVNNPKAKDNAMQSFFLGETLKYLYLTFCEDDVLPLDQWVFNTEAHPLPVHDPVIIS